MLAYTLPALLLLFGLVVILILARGSFCICSGMYVKAHCKAKTEKKLLAITFDDGPHPDITPAVLDILKVHKVKAGFFLIGKNLEKNPEILSRILSEGHLAGNHSYDHSNSYGFRRTKKVVEDLRRAEALIEDISGKKIMLFRPPFGVTNPNIARAARLLDYTVVGWSIRSFDTMGKKPERTIKRVISRFKPGRVILFHDNHEGILPILEEVINKAVGEGYEFVSPEELLNVKAYR